MPRSLLSRPVHSSMKISSFSCLSLSPDDLNMTSQSLRKCTLSSDAQSFSLDNFSLQSFETQRIDIKSSRSRCSMALARSSSGSRTMPSWWRLIPSKCALNNRNSPNVKVELLRKCCMLWQYEHMHLFMDTSKWYKVPSPHHLTGLPAFLDDIVTNCLTYADARNWTSGLPSSSFMSSRTWLKQFTMIECSTEEIEDGLMKKGLYSTQS